MPNSIIIGITKKRSSSTKANHNQDDHKTRISSTKVDQEQDQCKKGAAAPKSKSIGVTKKGVVVPKLIMIGITAKKE
eukprot:12076254-Ditylum_brightwellii.AAC.1